MRIAVGSLKQESNTFSPFLTDLEFFDADTRLRGDAVLRFAREARVELTGFLDALEADGHTAVPLAASHACSAGPLRRAAFATLLEELLAPLRAAMPVDAVLLALHGALVLENHPDGDALILHAVRETTGPGVPVAASLDLHGHITPEMLAPADLLVGFKRYPHTDLYETGARAARLLLDRLRGRIRPAMALAKRRMVLSPVRTTTDLPPFRDLMARTEALAADGAVLAASLFPVQPWLDVPDLGFAALVATDGDPEAARRIADALAGEAWDRRGECDPRLVPLDEALRRGIAARRGPVVIGDTRDAPSGGAPGDNNAVLRTLLAHGIDRGSRTALLMLTDAPAAAAAHRAGAGARISVPLGHTLSREHGSPVTVAAVVRALGDGRYRVTGPSMTGAVWRLGPTAVLAIGGIQVVVTERPAMQWDPGLYRAFGVDPAAADLVFVKSPSHFRVAYAPIASELILAETPGCTCCNMQRLHFRRARPLSPLDPLDASSARLV
jgi:microcystin degradation protein MlrC